MGGRRLAEGSAVVDGYARRTYRDGAFWLSGLAGWQAVDNLGVGRGEVRVEAVPDLASRHVARERLAALALLGAFLPVRSSAAD